MNKFEEQAVGLFLSEWSENLDYDAIIDELRNGNDDGLVTL